jgi:lipoprotein-anchoring transpeptidase ErfK/SrfK
MNVWRAIRLAICAGVACSHLLSSASQASASFESIFAPKPRSHVHSESISPQSRPRRTEVRLYLPSTSKYDGHAEAKSIEVHTKERALYLFTMDGRAIRYKVGVGRAGQQWFGSTRVASKHIKPAWAPPDVIRGNKPAWVAEPGAPNNPMGAAALVLADHELAIHGTNDAKSIGGYVSWGCIRMYNRDIMDLYSHVSVGTPVVIKH